MREPLQGEHDGVALCPEGLEAHRALDGGHQGGTRVLQSVVVSSEPSMRRLELSCCNLTARDPPLVCLSGVARDKHDAAARPSPRRLRSRGLRRRPARSDRRRALPARQSPLLHRCPDEPPTKEGSLPFLARPAASPLPSFRGRLTRRPSPHNRSPFQKEVRPRGCALEKGAPEAATDELSSSHFLVFFPRTHGRKLPSLPTALSCTPLHDRAPRQRCPPPPPRPLCRKSRPCFIPFPTTGVLPAPTPLLIKPHHTLPSRAAGVPPAVLGDRVPSVRGGRPRGAHPRKHPHTRPLLLALGASFPVSAALTASSQLPTSRGRSPLLHDSANPPRAPTHPPTHPPHPLPRPSLRRTSSCPRMDP